MADVVLSRPQRGWRAPLVVAAVAAALVATACSMNDLHWSPNPDAEVNPANKTVVVLSAFVRERNVGSATVLRSLDPRAQTAFLNRALDRLENREKKSDGEPQATPTLTPDPSATPTPSPENPFIALESMTSSLFVRSLTSGTKSFAEVPVTLTVQLSPKGSVGRSHLSEIQVSVEPHPSQAKEVEIQSWSQPRWTAAIANPEAPVRAVVLGRPEGGLLIVASTRASGDLTGTVEVDFDLAIKAARTCDDPKCPQRAPLLVARTSGDLNKPDERGQWVLPAVHPVALRVQLQRLTTHEDQLEGWRNRLRSVKKTLEVEPSSVSRSVEFVPTVWTASACPVEDGGRATLEHSGIYTTACNYVANAVATEASP